MRDFRSGGSRMTHIRALFGALCLLEELMPAEPSVKRIVLRDYRAALVQAYPHLKLTASDVAQMCAEEDGDATDG